MTQRLDQGSAVVTASNDGLRPMRYVGGDPGYLSHCQLAQCRNDHLYFILEMIHRSRLSKTGAWLMATVRVLQIFQYTQIGLNLYF
ncbi:hypothetical protein [Methylobacterium sp. J-076]|uniref:hypothetical protein n=1 Tax=Methylobacterium sp. J-076 TaxID=2836655 RepID=UPI001FB9DD31|nr:hypothetical protein [Methylobacterium sp. J-076]MCJ2011915.1 hypothetical protein [Methylobacterium sp. J-076]